MLSKINNMAKEKIRNAQVAVLYRHKFPAMCHNPEGVGGYIVDHYSSRKKLESRKNFLFSYVGNHLIVRLYYEAREACYPDSMVGVVAVKHSRKQADKTAYALAKQHCERLARVYGIEKVVEEI
jgi:hypothetical protein